MRKAGGLGGLRAGAGGWARHGGTEAGDRAEGCRRDQQEGPLGSKKQAGPRVEGADRLLHP